MLEYYGDVIAIRHHLQGAPHEAAHLGVGAGHQLVATGEHPTQVLTDPTRSGGTRARSTG